MHGTYDPWLVSLSIGVAIIASYVALDLASRVAIVRGTKAARYWLAGSAISMGIGVWSMHFIGMLAFQLPIPMAYDTVGSLFALLIAVVVSGFALHTVSAGELTTNRLVSAGICMGLGIAAMNYTGMEAMQIEPAIRYEPALVMLAIAIAIGAAVAALWLTFRVRTGTPFGGVPKKVCSAFAMGIAIAGMHYTAMAAATFDQGTYLVDDPSQVTNEWLATTIGAFALLVLLAAMLASIVDARLTDHSSRTTEATKATNLALAERSAELSRANALLRQEAAEREKTKAALRESEARYRLFTLLSADWIWEQDADLRFVDLPEREIYCGLTRADHIGKRRWELPNSEAINTTWEEHRAVLAAHKEFRNLLIRRLDAEGNAHYTVVSGSPIFDAEGSFKGYRGVGADITERLTTEERFRATFDQAAVGIAHISLDQRHLMVNRKYCEMLGYTREELEALGADAVFRADGSGDMSKARDDLLAGRLDHYSAERQYVRKNGAVFWVNRTISLARDARGKPIYYILVIEDISERKHAEERLTYMAQYDSLTGLPNRSVVRDRLSLAIARAKRSGEMLAVLFIDLDDFSDVNDSLGHACGDEVLQAAAGLLRTSLRDVDTIGRLGGDEFTAILEGVAGEEHATAVAEKLRKRLADPIVIGGREIFTSASIGIALYPHNGDTVDNALLQAADVAMYHAKGHGRNSYAVGNAAMTAEAGERLRVTALLRRALERQEFILHYQPVIDVRTHSVVAAEALLRLNSASEGMISPATFIPLAEATGLIVPIGEWVLKEACLQAKAWQVPDAPPLVVAVNISVRQLRGGGFVETLERTLSETGLPPHCLELEITESQLMEDVKDTMEKLSSIRKLGVGLAMDDFGTGYSSLGHLAKLPVDALKIDRSFVAKMLDDSDAMALVSTILTLARTLRLKVVAEGVETEGQEKALRLLRCDEMQGYLFSRPVPAADMTALLAKARAASSAAPVVQQIATKAVHAG